MISLSHPARLIITFLFALSLSLLPAESELHAQASLNVVLTAVQPSDQPVGKTIVWLAVATGVRARHARYQFRVGFEDGKMKTLRDFSPENYLQWTPMEEGTYTVQVTVKDIENGGEVDATQSYTIVSRIVDSDPVVSTTNHPLVFLYSSPPCESEDSLVRARFRPVRSLLWNYTPWYECERDRSTNFYIAGMRPETTYEIERELWSQGQQRFGPTLSETTGAPNVRLPYFRLKQAIDTRASVVDSVLLQSINGGFYNLVYPVATDLFGRLIWYYDFREYENPGFPWNSGAYLVQVYEGGTMMLFLNYEGDFDQILREVDLAGKPIRETNVEEVNRQLVAMGQDPITFFHHEATRLSNGHTLVLGSIERVLQNVQGEEETNVLADIVIDLDENLQVSWVWNAFEHLDIQRTAVLDEICTIVTVGCPPIKKGLTAKDWNHTNTIFYLPDGNLLLSMRNQDWVLKIDYRDGTGSGSVLWRLGEEGDFRLEGENVADDPFPWFSHQHDVKYIGDEIIIYDNGNTRCERFNTVGPCHSRGQVFELDEETMTARRVLNVDLGHYASAFGSAQKLSNGNYHFLSGIILPALIGHHVETAPDGEVVYRLETQGMLYRSFRMPSLYSPGPYRSPDDPPTSGQDGLDVLYLPTIEK